MHGHLAIGFVEKKLGILSYEEEYVVEVFVS